MSDCEKCGEKKRKSKIDSRNDWRRNYFVYFGAMLLST